MSDTLKTPFIFVPEGEPVPDALRGPEWIRIPATFVPHATEDAPQTAPATATTPRWQGSPPVPRGGMPPDQRLPGEAVDTADPVATFLTMDQLFRDPAKAAGIVPVSGSGRGSVKEPIMPVQPVGPAVPERDKEWLVARQPGKQPVYDIFVGGAGDESAGHAVLDYARNRQIAGHNVVYFPFDANVSIKDAGIAIGKFIDSLPADARINVIGHSYGGDTAAKAAAASMKGVDLLVTVDPVSLDRPDKKAVEAKSGRWINVLAVTGGKPTKGNIAAAIGGSWELYPEGTADVFIKSFTDHENFSVMMMTPGADGTTPQKALQDPEK